MFIYQIKLKFTNFQDKTFGLKNKKGAKQQKFIEQVQKQVSNKFNPNARTVNKTFNLIYTC